MMVGKVPRNIRKISNSNTQCMQPFTLNHSFIILASSLRIAIPVTISALNRLRHYAGFLFTTR